MKKHYILWALLIVAALWIFHIHYNRGVPVKRNG